MKFFFPLYILPALALSALVSAGVFISPTAGQTISSTDPFNLTWTSGKYFEENSFNITVLLARSPFTSTLSGVTLVEGLVSPDAGIKTYSAELAPKYFYGDNETGTFDVVIIESLSAGFGTGRIPFQYSSDVRTAVCSLKGSSTNAMVKSNLVSRIVDCDVVVENRGYGW